MGAVGLCPGPPCFLTVVSPGPQTSNTVYTLTTPRSLSSDLTPHGARIAYPVSSFGHLMLVLSNFFNITAYQENANTY